MRTSSDRLDAVALRRRAVIRAAWAAPIVVAAVAAPAAVASAPPVPTLYVSFVGSGDAGFVFVELKGADGAPLQQQFTIEGTPRGTDTWVAVFRPFTRADGRFSSTVPATVTEAYSAIRVTAVVAGYGTLTSQEQPLPFGS